MSAEVVALGAWCDLDPPEEATASPGDSAPRPASGWSALPPGAAGVSPGVAHIRVHEFAILADGRRVTIRDDLGFSSSSHRHDYDTGGTQTLDPWLGLTRESVEHDVRIVVLPDDDDSEDEHPYEYLRDLLRRQGIEVSEDQLRAVPYAIEFSERLERRLRDLEDQARPDAE